MNYNVSKCKWSHPWVLPFIRHGDDVLVVKVGPLVVTAAESLWGRLGMQPGKSKFGYIAKYPDT